MRIFAIIPARNEARTIRAVADSAAGQVERVIVVDDGSEDETAAALDGLAVDLIRRPTPGGKAAALAAGFEQALARGASLIVTLDGDGQHDPADITRLIDAAKASPGHLVLGARLRNRSRQPGIRRFANQFADFWVSWASGQRVPDSQTGFRVYPRGLLEKVRPSTRRRHGFVFETAMLIDGARAGFPCVAVSVDSVYHDDARPSYFRAGNDVLEITRFISGRILPHGFYLRGLWRSLRYRAKFHSTSSSGPRGYR